MRVTIVGKGRLLARLKGADTGGELAGRRALYMGAEDIFTETQVQVPVKTGFLKGSGEVALKGDMVEIKYTAPYAIYVHEILSNYHPNGKAKFVEDPMTEMGPGLIKDVADAVGKGMV